MKGKKINTDFVTNFITNCIDDGMSSSDQIIAFAKNSIIDIDNKIKEITNLKVKRTNLLDVVYSFEDYSNKNDITNDIKKLSYYKIGDIGCCKYICNKINFRNMKASDIFLDLHNKYSEEEILFCIKQLVLNKILHKIEDVIVKGDNYKDYMKVICEI